MSLVVDGIRATFGAAALIGAVGFLMDPENPIQGIKDTAFSKIGVTVSGVIIGGTLLVSGLKGLNQSQLDKIDQMEEQNDGWHIDRRSSLDDLTARLV